VSDPLPDDPAQWPSDPHQLLGVQRDAGPRDLRRAYTGLIRTYKPEQFPEQFRRIRAAYELALPLAEFNALLGGSGLTAAGGSPNVAHAAVADTPGPPRPFDPAEDAGALWELAAAGHNARAYTGLADLFRRRPEQADLPLRLYWLLALNPELDPGRDACTWLTDALRLGKLSGPAVELFRRELEELPDSALAAGDRLTSIDAPTDRLAGYLAARAAAAAWLERWDTVRAELDRGRQQVRPTDEVSWLRLLVTVIDHVAWSAGDGGAADDLLADCRREVGELGHLAVGQSEAFDRLEYLLQASAGWSELRRNSDVPHELLDLIPLAWVRPFPSIRPGLAALLALIVAAPQAWLRYLDAIASRNPSALAFVGNLFGQFQDRLAEPPAIPHPPTDLARLVQEFLYDQALLRYPVLRPHLLTFCIREAVGPEAVISVAPATEGGNLLRQVVPGDWSLRLVCWACRLAWG
jgi:hypothetical protein